MTLYLLRHGIAVDPGTPDFLNDADRPLTARGEEKLEQIARAMLALELSFDLILSSPYVRARQTAEIVARAFRPRQAVEVTECLTPGASPRKVIDLLVRRPSPAESVLLVGHEPHLSSLISLLVSGNTQATVLMKKGGFCKLSAETLKLGHCAQLEWLLTPKTMGLMA